MACEDRGLATAEWREPTSSDRLPIHRSESPAGYSSAGCSPAEPASASPVNDNSSSIPIQRSNQMRCSTHCTNAVQVALVVPSPTAVSSLLCTPDDISILRRQLDFGALHESGYRGQSVRVCFSVRGSLVRQFSPAPLRVGDDLVETVQLGEPL